MGKVPERGFLFAKECGFLLRLSVKEQGIGSKFAIKRGGEMITRYRKSTIELIWSDANKTALWQKIELAVIEARELLCEIPQGTLSLVHYALEQNKIDLGWWTKRDEEIHHDFQAFVEERRRVLPTELQQYFHGEGMTSYDAEEPALAEMLAVSVREVLFQAKGVEHALIELARKYRFTLIMLRTHGQEAELGTFGARCLTWLQQLRVSVSTLKIAAENLRFSKLSGATGKYTGLDPVVEMEALRILGLEPFYGSTQVMPRELYVPFSSALCQLVLTLNKVANDLRLGARSPRPIYQEPFGKKQKGSSAMPHKKNPIRLEQVEGMARSAEGYHSAIFKNISTWEERAIEQSCVERVAWPDLFHVTVHVLETMQKVLSGLRVYPDTMLWEVAESRGCYASSQAKEVLKKLGVAYGLSADEAYQIVQLAAFNAHEPSETAKYCRENLPRSLDDAVSALQSFSSETFQSREHTGPLISNGKLRVSEELEVAQEQVSKWNQTLRQIFTDSENLAKWHEAFNPAFLLRNLDFLYTQILGK